MGHPNMLSNGAHTCFPLPTVGPHPQVTVLQDTPRPQVHRTLQKAADDGAHSLQQLGLL